MGIIKKLIQKQKAKQANQYTQEERCNEFLLNCSGLLSKRQLKERDESMKELIKTVDELNRWKDYFG